MILEVVINRAMSDARGKTTRNKKPKTLNGELAKMNGEKTRW